MPEKSPRNKTIEIDENDKELYGKNIVKNIDCLSNHINSTINVDLYDILDNLPTNFVDLLIVDPPYNMNKNFNGFKFNKKKDVDYIDYLESWFPKLLNVMKENGSIYFCGDWKSSYSIYHLLSKYVNIQNRITWQREKGRGSKSNWKNSTEDIWFATMSNNYYFDSDAVKIKRKVLAPYKENGKPKDWEETSNGNFRLTYHSNFWDDITIPYWSMPENTEHPTQKPEKLIAKLILSSCPVNGIVFDPFVGSGTTSVVAKKLNRKYIGIDFNEYYCLLTEKRLKMADINVNIQGYDDGVFWERNNKRSK